MTGGWRSRTVGLKWRKYRAGDLEWILENTWNYTVVTGDRAGYGVRHRRQDRNRNDTGVWLGTQSRTGREDRRGYGVRRTVHRRQNRTGQMRTGASFSDTEQDRTGGCHEDRKG